MSLTHTFLGHNYACPTLRRRHTGQTVKSWTQVHSSQVGGLSLVHTQIQMARPLGESLSLHPWLACALTSLEYVLFQVTLHGARGLSRSKGGSLPALPTVFQINTLVNYKLKASMDKCCLNLGCGGHREPPTET